MSGTPPRYVLRNATVWLDGENKVGQATEMQTPNIKLQYENTRNAGMIREYPVLMGMEIDDGDIKMTALDPQAIKALGGAVGDRRIYRFVGELVDESDGAKHIAEYTVEGQLSEIDFSGWKPGELQEHGYMVKPFYGRFSVDSEVLLEWDEFRLLVDGDPIFDHTALLE